MVVTDALTAVALARDSASAGETLTNESAGAADVEGSRGGIPHASLSAAPGVHGAARWIGWKITSTFAGVTESADTEPTGGPFGAEGSAGDAADAALAPRGIPIGDPSGSSHDQVIVRPSYVGLILPAYRAEDGCCHLPMTGSGTAG